MHTRRRNHPADPERSTDQPFICEHCRQVVPGISFGTRNRNHCPACLWSLHVDLRVGDRRCGCHGQMEPISVWVKPDGEWTLVHRCRGCGALRTNRIAGDDNEVVLMSLALRPLANPAFPLDQLTNVQKRTKEE